MERVGGLGSVFCTTLRITCAKSQWFQNVTNLIEFVCLFLLLLLLLFFFFFLRDQLNRVGKQAQYKPTFFFPYPLQKSITTTLVA